MPKLFASFRKFNELHEGMPLVFRFSVMLDLDDCVHVYGHLASDNSAAGTFKPRMNWIAVEDIGTFKDTGKQFLEYSRAAFVDVLSDKLVDSSWSEPEAVCGAFKHFTVKQMSSHFLSCVHLLSSICSISLRRVVVTAVLGDRFVVDCVCEPGLEISEHGVVVPPAGRGHDGFGNSSDDGWASCFRVNWTNRRYFWNWSRYLCLYRICMG